MTRSNRRCNLSHSGSAGALSDFQQLNGPQCSMGFKGFVWLSGSRRVTFGCRPAFVWVMLQPSITAREVTALHQHFCPPTSNAFRSCGVHLSPQLHTFRRKQKPGAVRRKLELQANQRGRNHVTPVKEISDTLLPCKHLHKKITWVVSIPVTSSDASNRVRHEHSWRSTKVQLETPGSVTSDAAGHCLEVIKWLHTYKCWNGSQTVVTSLAAVSPVTPASPPSPHNKVRS